MKSASNRLLGFIGSCATALVVGGCAAGGVPMFKKIEQKEEALPDVHPIRKERASFAAKKFDTERNAAEYRAAAAEWRQGNFKACRDGLDKILHRDPEHRDSIILLAELELEQDQSENAVEILRKGIAAHQKDAEMSYKLGLALESAGEQSEALHHFHVAVQLAPQEKKYAEVFKHAEEHARQSGTVAAEESNAVTPPKPEAEPTIQLTSNEADLESSDATPENETTDNTAVEPIQSSSDSPEVLAIEAAAADWDAGRKPECLKAVAEILARDPKHIEANILQVEIDLDAGRNDEARERIERLVIRNSHNAQVRRACALAYEALGDATRAASAFAAAEALELGEIEDATPRSELVRAAAARNRAAAEESQSTTTPVVRTVSNSTATIQLKSSPEESALSSFADASTPNTSAPEVMAAESFGPTLPILGLTSEAGNAKAKPRLTAQQLVDKGEVFLKAGRFDEAKKELSAAISSQSCVVKTAAAAALAPLKYEQSELALGLAREGLKKYPDSAGLHRIEGTAALRLGRHLEAEAALRQSLNLDNSQALTYFLLGSVYERLGNQEASDRHLRQAARLDRRYATRK